MFRSVIAWLGGRFLIYVLLVVALVIGSLLATEWTSQDAPRQRVEELTRVKQQIEAERSEAQETFAAETEARRRQGLGAIRERRRQAIITKAALEGEQPNNAQRAVWLMRGDAAALLADRRRELRIAVLTREIDSLAAAEQLARSDATLARGAALSAEADVVAGQLRACGRAEGALERFDRDLRNRVLNQERRRQLAGERERVCNGVQQRREVVQTQLAALREARAARGNAEAAYQAAIARLGPELATLTAQIDQRIEADRRAISGSLRERARLWAERHAIADKARLAGWLLLAIILTPLAIRTLFFWVLAPIVARRPAIRLSASGMAPIPPAAPSATSLGVRLQPSEELLVRQDYLQSSSLAGAKATVWLLDWRHPLSSLAAGLRFLTRIRGDGELSTVSAVHDPFAEVTLLDLPEGAACVLHPRALAAVAQPIGRPLRIVSHWRFGSLHAWLTFQFRFLVFHGPARLVVKGGRGVRVEAAEQGRLFGQEQLVGFSADLAYSVARTETFLPYLFGYQPLLKDRVAETGGILIVEEAPLAGRGRGVRRGLEGAVDALLKPLGI